jgi:photosystem II stability/assembly factor-like uncharacterized protein
MTAKDWTVVGPLQQNGGRLSDFAKDPHNPQQMLTSTFVGGIYRTTDGGTTWQQANTGITLADGHVDVSTHSIVFDPNQRSVALAKTSNLGIFRSTDGGQSWANVYSGNGGSGLFLFVGSSIYTSVSSNVMVSSDGGKTWTVSLAGGATVASAGGLTLAAHSGKLYSLGSNGAWAQLPSQMPLNSSNNPINPDQLAIDPNNTQSIYGLFGCGRYADCIYASQDGGQTFNKVADNMGLGVQAIVFSTVFPHQLYAAGDPGSGWIATYGNAVYTNPPSGSTATPANPTWHGVGFGTDTRKILTEANTAGTDDRCYTVTDQGLHQVETCSLGKGQAALTQDPNITIHWITGFAVGSDEQNIIAMVQDYSAKASNDGGKTWHGLPIGEDGTAVTSPTNPLSCYGLNGGLFVSTDGCKTVSNKGSYRSIVAGAPANIIAFDPHTPTTMYLANGTKGLVSSTDGGNTFPNTIGSFASAVSVIVDPTDGLHMLVGDSQAQTLSVSVDGGATWTTASGLPSSASYVVAIDPVDPKTVIVGLGGADIYTSKNGGLTFTKTTHLAVSGFATLVFDSVTTGTPYLAMATTGSGAWLSKDLGATWQRLDGIMVPKIWGVQWVKGTLYACTYGQGILKTVSPMQ